jgi:polysaccharide pyruvyl transferase WcaK-like protein
MPAPLCQRWFSVEPSQRVAAHGNGVPPRAGINNQKNKSSEFCRKPETTGETGGHDMSEFRQRIGIFGVFGGGNLGNNGSLDAMIWFLQQARSGADIVCLCDNPAAVTNRYRIKALPYHVPRPPEPSLFGKLAARFRDLRSILRATRDMDILCVPGTGILDDFGEKPYGMPLTVYLVCLFARLQGIRIYFISIGAGPIENRLSRWLMKSAASLGHYRSYRDVPSKDFMKKLGLNVEDDEIYPDIAFKLKAPLSQEHHAHGQSATIGVGLMAYRGWRNDSIQGAHTYEAYLEKMVDFVLWLLDSGYNVRALIGQDVDNRAISDLSDRISLLRKDLAHERFVAEPADSLHELMAQIVQTDVVVATRFHNIVCALKLGRPTASIGYSVKFEALLKEVGLEEFCQHAETLDVELLKSQVGKLIKNKEMYEQRIRRSVLTFEERLKQQDRLLLSQFLDAQLPRAQ